MPTALQKNHQLRRNETVGRSSSSGLGGRGGGWEERRRRKGGGTRAKKDVQIVRRRVCLEAFGVGTYLARRAHFCKAARPHTQRHQDAAKEIKRPGGGGKDLGTDQWTSIFSHCIFPSPSFFSFFHPLPEMETQLTGARMLDDGCGGRRGRGETTKTSSIPAERETGTAAHDNDRLPCAREANVELKMIFFFTSRGRVASCFTLKTAPDKYLGFILMPETLGWPSSRNFSL